MSLIKLANYEEAEGTRAGPYTDFGADARGIATESRRIGTAAIAALKEREAALLTEHLIQEDKEKKQQAAAALEEAGATRFGGNPSKARKFAQLENEIASAEAAIVAAHAEYEKVKSRNEEILQAALDEAPQTLG
ncbi:hypothetical protein F751_6616 [Auxenochlorella protothecoides]|nr:hypothetical protein F751_6616 [Auxenochlorella protothecoides]KFM26659.1 hypothetical protein F751_6616 [Auxenochlorella protothecoides]